MKVIIDPRSRISYSSYYIEGLYTVFNKENVKFSSYPFKNLIQTSKENDFEHYFAFVCYYSNGYEKKIIVDYRDKNNLNLTALNWCDVYGKVNLNRLVNDYVKVSDSLKNKIIPIGPNFGIKLWNRFYCIFLMTSNYLKSIGKIPVNIKDFISGYNWQIKRNFIWHYFPSDSDNNYIFHISSLYYNQSYGETVNSLRAQFIRSCRNNNCIFEGGLRDIVETDVSEKYKDVIVKKYYSPIKYLTKTKSSSFVFNTPAVWGCHGWKLGEYLAMGKAIISTQFINEMPEAMKHRENIMFVKDEREMDETVKLLLSDKPLRKKLENAARKYYEKWLAPEIVIKRLISN